MLLLKRAEEIRLVADYTGDSVELDDARELVGQAERFVDAMRIYRSEIDGLRTLAVVPAVLNHVDEDA